MNTSIKSDIETADEDENGSNDNGVKTKVKSWLSGFVHEMRKKSPASIQKWVDSIADDDESNSNRIANNDESTVTIKEEFLDDSKLSCDNKLELKSDNETAGTSGSSTKSDKTDNFKVKLNEICNRLNVNETLKSKKSEFKNLITKLKRENSVDDTQPTPTPPMEHSNDQENLPNEEEEEKVENSLAVQRARIGVLGRSSSENPKPRNKRLSDIGRSFSVANENELPNKDSSSENLIYDADEDISCSITIPSPNTSSTISNPVTNNRANLLYIRPVREHTVSEGHASPIIQHKNPLLRDSSFQSDSSHCSSVESLLEARKPDAEQILMNLGFGPAKGTDDVVSKIPKRFLKPSQVKGVDTDVFLRNQQFSMNIHENSVLGYRGLLGSSHVPSDIVKKIIERFSVNEIKRMDSFTECRSFKGVAQTVLAQRHFMK